MALDYFIPGTTGVFPNRILLTIDNADNLSMKLDITVFPIFCDKCREPFARFYVHKGSRNGHVGSILCPNCGREVRVTDQGGMVDSICIGKEPVDFGQLYLLDWSYVEQLDQLYDGDVIKSLRAGYRRLDLNYMTLKDFTTKAAAACSLEITGEMQFCTDKRFPMLPPDVNHWIELLYRAGIDLPQDLEVTREGRDLPSMEGTGIWATKHPEEFLKSLPKRRWTVFERDH